MLADDNGPLFHSPSTPIYTSVENNIVKGVVIPEVLRIRPNIFEWSPSNLPTERFIDTHAGVVNVFRDYRNMVSSSPYSLLSPLQLEQMDKFFPGSVPVDHLAKIQEEGQ
jgi:hypothetical protein